MCMVPASPTERARMMQSTLCVLSLRCDSNGLHREAVLWVGGTTLTIELCDLVIVSVTYRSAPVTVIAGFHLDFRARRVSARVRPAETGTVVDPQ
jgi:hypothetical protein